MGNGTQDLPGKDFGTSLEFYRDGGHVAVVLFGLTVATWSVDDSVARDVFIAGGLALGRKGVTLARLAESWWRPPPAAIAERSGQSAFGR